MRPEVVRGVAMVRTAVVALGSVMVTSSRKKRLEGVKTMRAEPLPVVFTVKVVHSLLSIVTCAGENTTVAPSAESFSVLPSLPQAATLKVSTASLGKLITGVFASPLFREEPKRAHFLPP